MGLRARTPVGALVPLLAAALAAFAVVGADCRWLVALGGELLQGRFPTSLPFATADTAGWQNVPALAEVMLRVLWRAFGERGLVAVQVAAAAGAFAVLAGSLRRESRSPAARAAVALLVLSCCLPALLVVRNGLFSLLLAPVLLALLESESRLPSRRIWLAVPLLALWSNLHGGALLGYGILAVYVVLARRRVGAAVLCAGALALCATPVLWRTPEYYLGVSRNEAARRGVGLWAPPGTGVLDLLLVVAALALVTIAVVSPRRSWRAWEIVSVAGLAVGTVHSARLGMWLAFVAAFPAARALELRRPLALHGAVPALLAVLVLAGLVRTPYDAGSAELAREAARTGQPVLAESVAAEQVALAGGKVWVADPLDAFRRADQALYLDWLAGSRRGGAAVEHAALVLVRRGSPAGVAAAADKRLVRLDANARGVLYRVVAP